MTGSLLHDAFAHHTWANERILDACEALSAEQMETPVPGTFGPIAATLHHLIGTDGWYLKFFGIELDAIADEDRRAIAELRTANSEYGAAWTRLLGGGPDGEQDVVEHGDGWDFHAPLGFRLAQVIHHGTDHRSQICTGLTSLGIEPPAIDVWAYGEAMGRTRVERLSPRAATT